MMLPDSLSLLHQAFGWMVVHSLWQIALVWLVFKLLAWRLQRHNDAVYLLSLAALAVCALWSVSTFCGEYERLLQSRSAMEATPVFPEETVVTLSDAPGLSAEPVAASFATTAGLWLEAHAQQVGWAWFVCATLLWLRLLGGYWLIRRLRRGDARPPDDRFQELCNTWSERLNIGRAVALLESSRIGEPLTIGFWKPVILFPVGMLAGLTPAQTEALLLHELAHIRRYDYLVNLFQLGFEVIFFYHPLFWLLSREARSRREYCCDDVVLRFTSDPLLYARTLTDLQLSLVHTKNQFTMNATGNNHFTERILRIAGITPNRSLRSNWLILMLLPMFIGLSSWWPAIQPARPAESETNASLPQTADDIRTAETALFPTDSIVPGRKRTEAAPGAPAPPEPAEPASPGSAASPAVVAVETEKMNVLYIGVDNPVMIAVPGHDCSTLKPVLKGNGSMNAAGECRYNVRVSEPGTVNIEVYGQGGALLGNKAFRVKRIPDAADQPAREYSDLVDYSEKKSDLAIRTSEPGQVAVQAVNMNVFYIGIDNPLRVAASGLPAEELLVRMVGNGNVKGSMGVYSVGVTTPGEVTIQVYRAQDGKETLLYEQPYRVKRIPDPTPKMAGRKSQSITKDILLKAGGVDIVLENFDFDAYCEVVGYELTIVPAKGDPVSFNVTGSAFPAKAVELFHALDAGGAVFMDDIKIKCPGDAAPRNVGGLAYKIKGAE